MARRGRCPVRARTPRCSRCRDRRPCRDRRRSSTTADYSRARTPPTHHEAPRLGPPPSPFQATTFSFPGRVAEVVNFARVVSSPSAFLRRVRRYERLTRRKKRRGSEVGEEERDLAGGGLGAVGA